MEQMLKKADDSNLNVDGDRDQYKLEESDDVDQIRENISKWMKKLETETLGAGSLVNKGRKEFLEKSEKCIELKNKLVEVINDLSLSLTGFRRKAAIKESLEFWLGDMKKELNLVNAEISKRLEEKSFKEQALKIKKLKTPMLDQTISITAKEIPIALARQIVDNFTRIEE